MTTPAPTSIYRQRGFLPFALSRLLAFFAAQIQGIVVAWQVYTMTRDPMTLAYVGLAQFLPMLLLLIPAGDLIDRFDRKKILLLSWGIQGLCSAALALLTALPINNPTWFYFVLLIYGAGRAFTGPALQSLLPQIVPKNQLAAAIAANSMIMRIASISGPILGGSIYAVGGGQLTYNLCFLSFMAAIILLQWVPVLYGTQGTQQKNIGAWQRFTAGIQFIRSRPIILGTISLDLFAVLLGGVVALLPMYASDILQVGSQGLGALRSAMAIGEVTLGFYLSIKPFNRHLGLIMFGAVILFGLANLLFSLSKLFWLSFLALMIAGAADMVSVYIRSTLIQFSTPDEMRGRVNAVNMLFISSSNELGEFRAGAMAAWVGLVPAAVLGCIFTLAVAGTWMRLFPSLRQVNRFEEANLPNTLVTSTS